MPPGKIPHDAIDAWLAARGTPAFPVMSFPLRDCPSLQLARAIVRARAYLGAAWVEPHDYVSDTDARFYEFATHITDQEAFHLAQDDAAVVDSTSPEEAAEQAALTALYLGIERAVAALIDHHRGKANLTVLKRCAAELEEIARDREQRRVLERAAQPRQRAHRAHESQPAEPAQRSARAKAGAAMRPRGCGRNS